MSKRHLYGVLLGAVLAILLAILQPWKSSHLDSARAKTVVLVVLDALRRDHVGAYAPAGAAPRAETPHMNRLAEQSLRFDDARTPVPLTLPSHACMLTGRTPAATGVRVNSQPLAPRAQRGFPLVTERLRRNGWRTGAFVSAETLAARYGLDSGFEVYDDKGQEGLAGALSVPERRGSETVKAALRWLDNDTSEGDHVFLFVHLFEPHYPWEPNYRADCEDGDRIVGELLDGLASRGRGGAAVILTADHGEALGELGERTHGVLLSDGSMRVPLLIKAPGVNPGVRTDPVCGPDLAPTIAWLAGFNFDEAPGAWEGRNLLGEPLPADRPRVAESLYGHHRFRWAQLAASVMPNGQLVDAGSGRAHWLPVQPYGEDLAGTEAGAKAPDIAALSKTLSSYKSTEQAALMSQAYGITGYGAGGKVTPFLQGPDNARLPDPHTFVSNADILSDMAAATARAETQDDIDRIARRLRAMQQVDRTNPEVPFRLGRALQRGGDIERRKPNGGSRIVRQQRFAGAERAFERSWQAGRRDEGALIAWCGVNAGTREVEMLTRLAQNAGTIGTWTCQMWTLKAMLLRGLMGRLEAEGQEVPNSRDDELVEAFTKAWGLCTKVRHLTLLERIFDALPARVKSRLAQVMANPPDLARRPR